MDYGLVIFYLFLSKDFGYKFSKVFVVLVNELWYGYYGYYYLVGRVEV